MAQQAYKVNKKVAAIYEEVMVCWMAYTVEKAEQVYKEVVGISACDSRSFHNVDPCKRQYFCRRLLLDSHMLPFHSASLQQVGVDTELLVCMESNRDLQKALG
jgi:hypothetical protein